MASLPKTLSVGAVAVLAAIATGVGISQATADPSSSPSSTPSSSPSESSGAASANSGTPGTTDGMPGRGFGRHGHGPDGMGRGGMGWGMDASALADQLGVDEAKLTAALQKVRTSMQDSDEDRTGPPTEAERTARQQEFAAALAKELGIDQAKVTAALDALRAERQADARAAFSARLDEAVKAGKLTEADKASVLKAFDAGVLGGGFGNH